MRLHGVFGLDGTPRALMLVGADRPEREIALNMLPRALHGGETVIGDKNYSGRQFTADITALGGHLMRPARHDEPQTAPRLSMLRQRVESIFWTCKDLLSLERHGARTLHGLRTRLACRFLALAAAVSLNHRLGLPSRALAQYIA